jgi:phosphoribosylanthranilate isomerase
MTHVKICGMTNKDDVAYALACGADYIGLIFAPSKRKIIKETALRILDSTPDFTNYVGVFLNGKKKEIEEICDFTGIRIIQLHGDETPAFCNYFKNRGYVIIKAFRIKNKASFAPVAHYDKVDYFLFDTYVTGHYGGTGESFDWSVLTEIKSLKNKKYFVSGGLDASNLRDLLSEVEPFGVDASSRLETSPGKKDHQKIKDFFRVIKETKTDALH